MISGIIIIACGFVSYELLSNTYFYVLNINTEPDEILILVSAILFLVGVKLATALYGFHLSGHHEERTLKNYKKHFGLLNLGTGINILMSAGLFLFLGYHVQESETVN